VGRPAPETVVILIVITVNVAWLLQHGYSIGSALGIVVSIGLLTAVVGGELAAPPAGDV
jgi:hypothetical protein